MVFGKYEQNLGKQGEINGKKFDRYLCRHYTHKYISQESVLR